MQATIGCFGLSGKVQIMPMRNLFDGQKSRVIFVWLAWRLPYLLLLSEPTNHLDIETIDVLIDTLNHSSDIRNTRIFRRCSKRSIFKYFKI